MTAVMQVLQLAAQQPLVQPCAGLHPVQPLHGPAPEQFYSSCGSVQQVAEVLPVLDFIQANAHQLVGLTLHSLQCSPALLVFVSSCWWERFPASITAACREPLAW